MATNPQQEISFYSDEYGVRVTNSRFIVRNVTYAMLNITSVKKSYVPPDLAPASALLAFGLLTLLVALLSRSAVLFVLSIAMFVVGIVMWRKARPAYGI